MLKKIPYTEAVQMLLALPVSPKTKKVSLFEAQGATLAKDIVALQNVPPFDRSPYDGYALMGEDTAEASEKAPVTLRVIEEVPAGTAPTKTVTPGTAVKILTGGPLPKGANCIIKFEDTSFTPNAVTLHSPISPGSDIIRAGEDTKMGELLAAKGSVIKSAMLAVFASQGIAEVEVFEAPRVGVISTGSELKMPGENLLPGQIYNSNLFSIMGFLKDAGCEPVSFGIVPDEPSEIISAINEAFKVCNCVLTTGGASVGDYDWAVTAAEGCGAAPLFWKLGMKPGGAMVAAQREGKLLLSLSGNPAAALTGFHVVAAPYLRKLCGRAELLQKPFLAKLKHPMKKKSMPPRFLRGHLEIIEGTAHFVTHTSQGNGDTLSFTDCDVIGCIPGGSPPLEAGTEIEVFYI